MRSPRPDVAYRSANAVDDEPDGDGHNGGKNRVFGHGLWLDDDQVKEIDFNMMGEEKHGESSSGKIVHGHKNN
jgi:hypothetical protein